MNEIAFGILIVIIGALLVYVGTCQHNKHAEEIARIKAEKEEAQRIWTAVCEVSPLLADVHTLALKYPVEWKIIPHGKKVFFVYSKQAVELFDFEKKIIEWVSGTKSSYKRVYDIAMKNRENWDRFLDEIDEEYDYYVPDEIIDEIGIDEDYFHDVEYEAIEAIKKHCPPMDTPFYFAVEYTSPKGNNSYRREETLDVDDMTDVFNAIEQIEERKRSAEYQRQLLTPKLRKEILDRDGHKCVICGRSARDGIVLHVDHIIPVSKGGLTTRDNLRTLCQDCNLGKSDSYDPDGLN